MGGFSFKDPNLHIVNHYLWTIWGTLCPCLTRYSNIFPGSCDATRADLWPRKVCVWHGMALLSSFCPYRGCLKFFLQEMSFFFSSSSFLWIYIFFHSCLTLSLWEIWVPFPQGNNFLVSTFQSYPHLLFYFSLCLEGVRAKGDNQRDNKLPSLTWEMISMSLGHFWTLAVLPKVLKDADFRGSLDSSLAHRHLVRSSGTLGQRNCSPPLLCRRKLSRELEYSTSEHLQYPTMTMYLPGAIHDVPFLFCPVEWIILSPTANMGGYCYSNPIDEHIKASRGEVLSRSGVIDGGV